MRNIFRICGIEELKMLIQISAGQGPIECEFAVGLLAKSLQKEFSGLEIKKKPSSRGRKIVTVQSLEVNNAAQESALKNFEGTIIWICQSPFRQHFGGRKIYWRRFHLQNRIFSLRRQRRAERQQSWKGRQINSFADGNCFNPSKFMKGLCGVNNSRHSYWTRTIVTAIYIFLILFGIIFLWANY